MTQNNRYEQQFLDALKDIFIGAKVEGNSGYINLMRIKSRYFSEGVFPQLMKDINVACKPFDQSFREELFDKLYDFFKRYFSENGSIYFRHTPQHDNIYEKVYTDERDVMLFWKTHMLYYVKTDRLFNSMDVDIDGTLFYFDASKMELKRSNEKRELLYNFEDYKAGKVVLSVAYSEKGRKTKTDDILRALKAKAIVIDEDVLLRACRVFEKQSEVDYFINKNAKAFLKEQFDLWMYQYIFSAQSDFDEKRLKQLQAIKRIANNIIDFIAQFEDELVRIWNKPKFVLNSHYVITLDKITKPELRKKVLNHPGMKAQVQEWQELGMVTKAFETGMLFQKDDLQKPANSQYQFLPLDTRHFSELELDILTLFEDLDTALDGWLIHSENYQALKTLTPKFREKVKCVYIDPPYNADSSEIAYENKYKDSSWLSLMENRITACKPFLSKDSVFVCAINEIEQENLGQLLSYEFKELEKTCVVVIHNATGQQGTNFSSTHEYAYFIYPRNGKYIGIENRDDSPDVRPLRNVSKGSHLRSDAANCFYPISVKAGKIVGFGDVCDNDYHPISINVQKSNGIIEVYPIDQKGIERKWVFARDTVESIFDELEARYNEKKQIWDIIRTKKNFNYKTVWSGARYSANSYGSRILNEILPDNKFAFPKSIFTVSDCIDAATNNARDSLIIDFFAGSGTTAHSIIDLNRRDKEKGNRKYILVEMGDYFNTVILPRVKKVVFSSNWKDGKAQEGKGISHFIKYFDLEQYEDSLHKANYQDSDMFTIADAYNNYVFMRDLKMLDAISLVKDKNKVDVHLEKLYQGIDLAETLSCVTGRGIKRITKETVEFQDGTSSSLVNPDWELIKPLVWW